jgi:hypothetical protein
MALFTLSDITYKEQEARTVRPITTSEYSQNLLKYPLDIGSVDKGHYMIIHINVQDKTEYFTNNYANDPRSTIHKNRENLFKQTGATNLGGQANSLIGGAVKLGQKINTSASENYDVNLADSIKNVFQKGVDFTESTFKSLNIDPTSAKFFIGGAVKQIKEDIGSLNEATFLRRTKRTTDSIALYMPNTLNFTHSQSYSDISLGGEMLATAGAIGKTLLGGDVDAKQRGRNLSPFVLQKMMQVAGSITNSPNSTAAIFAGATGLSQNPQLELIYSSPAFRSFRFSFMFYPRSEQEAFEVQRMIARLKFHQAPEIKNGSAGYFLVPPSEFDIEFYYNGQINKNIPSISTCVLESIDMDYAPNGFHTFETPGDNSPKVGGTGMPTAIRMDLSFRETEIMTKFNFQEEAGVGTKDQAKKQFEMDRPF